MPDRDGWEVWFTVRSGDAPEERACVRLLAPMLLDLHLRDQGYGTFEENKQRLATLAVLDNLDGLTEVPPDPYGNRIIDLEVDAATALLQRPRLSDREIRRFLMRRVYDHVSRSTLDQPCAIDNFDVLVCGAKLNDLIRNAQILQAEGYLRLQTVASDGMALQPRASLIRAVERFGAAPEDAASENDVLAAVSVYSGLRTHLAAIQLEYSRYVTARTSVELESVFRALAPIVEDVVKDVLHANGSSIQHPTLGPAISDLRQRNLGNVGLWSQLNHILKFARDLTQHGTSLSEPVLRIACENCFQLLPQLGALYP